MFTNAAILPELLPSIREIEFQPLARQYRAIHMLSWLLMLAVPLLLVTLYRYQPFWPAPSGFAAIYTLIVSALGVALVLIQIYLFFADARKGYALREGDLHFRSGLFFISHVCQPILRIQHIELKRGPLERMANLATLQVFSAGGAMHTFQIEGLPESTAINIREFILSHNDVRQDK